MPRASSFKSPSCLGETRDVCPLEVLALWESGDFVGFGDLLNVVYYFFNSFLCVWLSFWCCFCFVAVFVFTGPFVIG